MDNMAKFLQLHQMIDLDGLWLAHPVDVISSKVDEHDMLCPILF